MNNSYTAKQGLLPQRLSRFFRKSARQVYPENGQKELV